MKLLVIGLNYVPDRVGIGPFTAGLAEFLAANGNTVVAHTASPYYPEWKIAEGYANAWTTERVEGVQVMRAPVYIPSKPTGGKRVLHLISFSLSAAGPVLRQITQMRPDIVLCVAPSLLSVPLAWIAARLARCPLWIHVQDFEVEAAFATKLLKGRGAVAAAGKKIEQYLLSRADLASTISPAMCRKLEEKGIARQRIFEFRNWAEIDAISPLHHPSIYRQEWDIEAPHVALYSGNIGNKQGIEIIVEAADLLCNRADIVFVICGNGSNREDLEERAKGLKNVIFRDLQPRERLSELLGLASVHLLPQIAGAADLVLPSKLANMLASGRPVVATAELGTGLEQEVVGCGLVVEPGNSRAFADAIVSLIDDQGRRQALGRRGRQRAIEAWSRTHILERVAERLASAGASS